LVITEIAKTVVIIDAAKTEKGIVTTKGITTMKGIATMKEIVMKSNAVNLVV